MNKFCILIIMFCIFSGCKHTGNNKSRGFELNLQTLAQKNDPACKLEQSAHFGKQVLYYKPAIERNALLISGIGPEDNWGKAKYLVCEVYHDNPYSALLYFDFYSRNDKSTGIIEQQGVQKIGGGEAPRITILIGVLPFIKSKVILPLSYLDGQNIFLPRFPGQLKGYIAGHRLAFDELGSVKLRLGPYQSPDFQTRIEIASMYLTNELPESYTKLDKPVADQFGQWNYKEWPGKIKDEKELKERILKVEKDVSNSSYPANWSKYGGLRDKQFKATGFFGTQFDGKRWWLVDPEGCAFVSNGIDCITPKIESVVFKGKNERFFKWLPEAKDTLIFEDAIRINTSGYIFDFYRANLIRVYGKDWQKKWEEITANMLKSWGINTIANWSDIEFAKRAKIPYVLPLRSFPDTKVRLFRDFPDVFSEEYRDNARSYAQQLAGFKGDPYLIGYFLSNEPQWAFGDFNLAFEMFASTEPSYTKKAFIEWLRSRYNNNPESLNKAWGLAIRSLEELEGKVLKEKMLTPSSEKDMKEFSGVMVDKYIKTACEEVKKIDPDHLNLGMRYPSLSTELLYRAGTFFDVFSINGYSFPGPPATDDIYKRVGKPIMIGEFHFGALDRGLSATGLRGVATQVDKGNAIRYYTEQGFARPEIIGLHYFQWFDQSITGRSDGENYNIGLVDICNQPYSDVVKAIKITNERLYEVAAGLSQPYDTIAERIPTVCY